MVRTAFFVAFSLVLFAATASQASSWKRFGGYERAEVRMALLDRAEVSDARIAELRGQLNGAALPERKKIMRKIFVERLRKRQLQRSAHIAMKLPRHRVALLVAKYELPVSPHRNYHWFFRH